VQNKHPSSISNCKRYCAKELLGGYKVQQTGQWILMNIKPDVLQLKLLGSTTSLAHFTKAPLLSVAVTACKIRYKLPNREG
jgi:hypothetical protein